VTSNIHMLPCTVWTKSDYFFGHCNMWADELTQTNIWYIKIGHWRKHVHSVLQVKEFLLWTNILTEWILVETLTASSYVQTSDGAALRWFKICFYELLYFTVSFHVQNASLQMKTHCVYNRPTFFKSVSADSNSPSSVHIYDIFQQLSCFVSSDETNIVRNLSTTVSK
jgi:hypothetical protein